MTYGYEPYSNSKKKRVLVTSTESILVNDALFVQNAVKHSLMSMYGYLVGRSIRGIAISNPEHHVRSFSR